MISGYTIKVFHTLHAIIVINNKILKPLPFFNQLKLC